MDLFILHTYMPPGNFFTNGSEKVQDQKRLLTAYYLFCNVFISAKSLPFLSINVILDNQQSLQPIPQRSYDKSES